VQNTPVWLYGLALVALLALLLLTGTVRAPSTEPQLKPQVISVDQVLAPLRAGETATATATLVEIPTASLFILRIESTTPTHSHKASNEILYVLRGQGVAISPVDEEFELRAGKMLIVFAGTPIRLERRGDQPLDLLVFSTPPSTSDEVVLLENSEQSTFVTALNPMLIDIAQRMAQKLDREERDMEFTVVAEMQPTGSVEFARVTGKVGLHHHRKENHMIYIVKGYAKTAMGSLQAEIGPDQIVIVPAGVKHEFEQLGDEPLEFILFSTPPFDEKDAVWD